MSTKLAAPNTPIMATPIFAQGHRALPPPRFVAKRAVEQASCRVSLALVHGLALSLGAALQSPDHDEGAGGHPKHVEHKHGRAQAVGIRGMPPLEADLGQVDAKARGRFAAEFEARKDRKGLGADARSRTVRIVFN